LRAAEATTYVDLEFRAGCGEIDGHVCHADRFLHVWSLCATRHHTDLLSVAHDPIAMAGGAPTDQLESHQLPSHPALPPLAPPPVTDEGVLPPADNPSQVRFEHRRRFVDVVAVETHGRLEPQRVARRETAWDDVGRTPRLQECPPHLIRLVGPAENL